MTSGAIETTIHPHWANPLSSTEETQGKTQPRIQIADHLNTEHLCSENLPKAKFWKSRARKVNTFLVYKNDVIQSLITLLKQENFNLERGLEQKNRLPSHYEVKEVQIEDLNGANPFSFVEELIDGDPFTPILKQIQHDAGFKSMNDILERLDIVDHNSNEKEIALTHIKKSKIESSNRERQKRSLESLPSEQIPQNQDATLNPKKRKQELL